MTECKGTKRIGRKPQGEAALTGAERQARYRLRLGLAADHAPGQMAKPARARPLSRRWHETVAGLVSLQAEYARWLDALPEATRDTATGDALQAMVDLDLEDIIAIQPTPWLRARLDNGDGPVSHDRPTRPHDTLPARPF